MTEQLIVTTGKQWRETATVVLRLPSGRVARVRAVGPDVLLRHGGLADSLTPLVAQMIEGENRTAAPQTMNDLKAITEFMSLVCQCAFVEPRVVDNPTEDDEISVDDIDWPDKEFLMGIVGASTRHLENFRDQQTSPVDTVVPATRHRPTRKPTPKPKSVGA